MSLSRVLDPHGQVTGRRRTTSINSRDHLGSVQEEHAEENNTEDEETETTTSVGGKLIILLMNCILFYKNQS